MGEGVGWAWVVWGWVRVSVLMTKTGTELLQAVERGKVQWISLWLLALFAIRAFDNRSWLLQVSAQL